MGKISDFLRERRINRLYRRNLLAEDWEDRREIWGRLLKEINKRSPAQIQRMEKRMRDSDGNDLFSKFPR